MTCQTTVYQWTATVQRHLPHLSKPQASVLGKWSLGVMLTRSCSLSAVSLLLSQALERPQNTVRQQLREWYYEAARKRGPQRRSLAVEASFAPLLQWVLRGWQGRQLALALDATYLHERFVVLCVSVLYRGLAIPVAWQVLRVGQRGSWRGHWLRLLRQLRPAVPPQWEVIVLADRGLYGAWLFRRIVRLGWHPLLRINGGGSFEAQGQAQREPIAQLVTRYADGGSVAGVAFTGPRRLPCTLAIYQEQGCAEPWLVVTDLAPAQCQACWYSLRAWIEHGFKLTKREGWQWQRSRIQDTHRAARQWLVMAVATLGLVVLGSRAEDAQTPTAARCGAASGGARQVSLFRQGWIACLVALWRGPCRLLPARPALRPEPWPCVPPKPPDHYDTS